MIKKSFYFITTLLVVFGMLAATTPAFALNGKSGLKGTVAAVDTVGNTVTITPLKGGANVVLKVDSKTLITRNHDKAKLATLQIGDKVDTRFDSATMIATSISATFTLGEIIGTVAAIDKVGNTITIKPNSGGTNLTVHLNSSTLFRRNGDPAIMKVGDKVKAKYNPITLIATFVDARQY